MRLKIKWNDDRVKGATIAILLLGRERLARGSRENLVQAALAEYRADPEAYKAGKAAWAAVGEPGPLAKHSDLVYYRNLQTAVDQLMQKMTLGKRQFNSLLELDNYLVSSLGGVR